MPIPVKPPKVHEKAALPGRLNRLWEELPLPVFSMQITNPGRQDRASASIIFRAAEIIPRPGSPAGDTDTAAHAPRHRILLANDLGVTVATIVAPAVLHRIISRLRDGDADPPTS